jgi:hypothetical protein
MIDRRELLFLAATAAGSVASSGEAAPAHPRGVRTGKRAGSRGAEVQALRRFAQATHPRGREAREDRNWASRWSQLERNADALSDGAYFVETRRALAWFEDGHTTVLPFEFTGHTPPAFANGPFSLHLPWKVRLFDDGAYIVSGDGSVARALGARVQRVGRLSIIALMRAWDESWPGNRAWAQNWAGTAFGSPAQLQGLGALRDAAQPLPIQTSAGGTVSVKPTRVVEALTEISRSTSLRERWAEAAGRDNYVKPLPERRALYLSIDDMADVKGATFEQLTRDSFAAMESPLAERLIIDLRRNGGGDNYLGEPLRKHIGRSRFNRPGGLYVLIGPATFSAAQNLANRLERETFAIFVGQPTGLGPNHYGDAKIFTGPVTGLTAMVSTLPWFDSYPQDKRPWIMPDLAVPATFADWREGRDPALDLALTHRSEVPAEDWSRDRTFQFDRDSQKAEWKPFWA